MPSHYRRKPGSRRYIDYSIKDLEECLTAIRSKLLTQRAAAEKYNIPRSTIKNKLSHKFNSKPGRPAVFTQEEEKAFAAHLTALSEYGFPLTDIDLRIIIKDFLESQGRTVAIFKNNIPGRDWVKSFLCRNRGLSRRLSNNIKQVRSQVDETIISEFINNIQKVTEDVPPENIYNYDETNLCDDPGKRKVICRRGSKYPETIVNATKISFTVMFCANAAGEAIPPYIVFKAENLWTTWTRDGPEGARYNRTKSGWMDSATFEDWFLNHLLPKLKKKEGRKVIIGDNLASHINKKVLSECEKYDIAFVCLPPHATHILQPLDVAYFRPLKCKWRQILLNWKNSQMGRKLQTTPKDQFPRLLKEVLDSLTSTKEDLISGFRKSGIYPINKEEPLARLPNQDRILNSELVGNTFIKKLEQSRFQNTILGADKKERKKKLNVPPGLSISASDVLKASTSGVKVTKKNKTITKSRPRHSLSSSSSENESTITLASSTEDHILALDDSEDDVAMSNIVQLHGWMQSELDDISTAEGAQDATRSKMESRDFPTVEENKPVLACSANNIVTGDHVLVTWNSRKYPGQILSTNQEGAFVSCLKRGKSFWRWPMIKDEQLYSWDRVVCKIKDPKLMKKGCFSIPEMDNPQ